MENEWGRELDLKDAASGPQIWGDLWLLLAVQGLPVPIVLCVLFAVWFAASGWCIWALLAVGIECILACSARGFVFGDRTFLRYN